MSDPSPGTPSASRLLLEQLDLVWLFADSHVLPRVTDEVLLWRPCDNVVTMRRDGSTWTADWPDEGATPLPEPTVAWLLWHIEWWWGNAAHACTGGTVGGPDSHQWSGSVDGVRQARARWDEVLATTAPGVVVRGLMPEPSSFGFVAAWVNFELTKNISEIGQLLLRHANAAGGPPPRPA